MDLQQCFCERHLRKQISFMRQIHWVSMLTLALQGPSNRGFFSTPILCSEIPLACSFIMLNAIYLLICSLDLNCCFLSLHLLTAVTCLYPTQSNNQTQFGKVPSLYTFRHKSYTSCCTLRTPILAAVELCGMKRPYSLAPCVYRNFALIDRSFVSQKPERYQ